MVEASATQEETERSSELLQAGAEAADPSKNDQIWRSLCEKEMSDLIRYVNQAACSVRSQRAVLHVRFCLAAFQEFLSWQSPEKLLKSLGFGRPRVTTRSSCI